VAEDDGVDLLERLEVGDVLCDSVPVGEDDLDAEELGVLEGEPELDAVAELELEALGVVDELGEADEDAELELEVLAVIDGLPDADGDVLDEAVEDRDGEDVTVTDSVADTVAVMLVEGLPDGEDDVLGETVSCGWEQEKRRERKRVEAREGASNGGQRARACTTIVAPA
jgi:hypothetical protein